MACSGAVGCGRDRFGAGNVFMSSWDFWIDRGGTFTDVIGRAAGRLAGRAQAAVGKPGGLSRRRGAGHPRPARPCSRRADPAGRGRRGEDGHHGRHQRAARAQGRAHAAADHRGLPRRAQDRLPGAAEDLRARRSSSRTCCTSASPKSTSACAPTARSSARPISPACARDARSRASRRHRRGRDRVHARLPLSRARAAGGRAGARAWALRRCRSATRCRR